MRTREIQFIHLVKCIQSLFSAHITYVNYTVVNSTTKQYNTNSNSSVPVEPYRGELEQWFFPSFDQNIREEGSGLVPAGFSQSVSQSLFNCFPV